MKPDIEEARYQALKAEIERLGYKVEDIPRLMAEIVQVLNSQASQKAG